MLIDNKNNKAIYPHFDGGIYKNEWYVKDDRIQQAYYNGDKYIIEQLNYAILGAFENILLPYAESKKYLINDYIIPKDEPSVEPLLITSINENSFTLYSEEKRTTHEIEFKELFNNKLYKG